MANGKSTDTYLEMAQAALRFIDTRKRQGPEGSFWSLVDAANGRPLYYDEISMYAGASGILCFLLALYDATGQVSYLEEAKEAGVYLSYRWAKERDLKRNFSPYAFSSGWSGAAFASLQLFRVTGEEAYAALVASVVEQILGDEHPAADGTGVSWSSNPGIVGDAGTILFLLHAAKMLGREDWKEAAIQAGRGFLGRGRDLGRGRKIYTGVDPVYFGAGQDYIDPNFPMGTAGIGFLLLRLYEAGGDKAFLEAVRGIPEYLEEAAVTIRRGRLLPHGLPKNPRLFYLGYCHGPAGTVRFYYELAKLTGKKKYRAALRSLVRGLEDTGAPSVRSEGYWNTYNICCGTAGLLNMYLGLWAAYGEPRDLEKAQECGKVLLSGARKEGEGTCWRFALDRIAPEKLCTPIGLFDGAAGIGAALLQLALAQRGRFRTLRMLDDPFPAQREKSTDKNGSVTNGVNSEFANAL